jgi:GAF domain
MDPSSAPQNSHDGAVAQATSPLHAGLHFPAEDRGESLAAMAQRDLDAALQLLAERAQYITSASGAAIALRRTAEPDMLCRASAGTNAPELGALLSSESGLSGESVRMKQVMRCDDASRDARVNKEGCRQLGIASVVVVPILSQDEVLGVFELFAGSPHAFGDRDVDALRRLGQMVETAVRQAEAAQAQMALFAQAEAAKEAELSAAARPRMWSATEAPASATVIDTGSALAPPSLRNLRECKACGFPVSDGRELCVECEERKWRGQPLRARNVEPATDKNMAASGGAAGVAQESESSADTSQNTGVPSFGMTTGGEESWLATNRHILLAVGAGAVAAVVIFLLRSYMG